MLVTSVAQPNGVWFPRISWNTKLLKYQLQMWYTIESKMKE